MVEELWKQFSGRENDDQCLSEKAELLASVIPYLSAEFTVTLADELTDPDSSERVKTICPNEIVLETSILLLHLADRQAFSHLQEKQRKHFSDSLYRKLRDRIGKAYKDERERFASIFLNLCNKRQEEYGRCKKIFPGDTKEIPGGTVFWEFGKRICNLLEKDKDLATMMVILDGIFKTTKFIDIETLLTKK